jgi:hypothetical protein
MIHFKRYSIIRSVIDGLIFVFIFYLFIGLERNQIYYYIGQLLAYCTSPE